MTNLMSRQKPNELLDAIKTGEHALEIETPEGVAYVVTDPIYNEHDTNTRKHEIRHGFSYQSPRCTNKRIGGMTALKLIMEHDCKLIERDV